MVAVYRSQIISWTTVSNLSHSVSFPIRSATTGIISNQPAHIAQRLQQNNKFYNSRSTKRHIAAGEFIKFSPAALGNAQNVRDGVLVKRRRSP